MLHFALELQLVLDLGFGLGLVLGLVLALLLVSHDKTLVYLSHLISLLYLRNQSISSNHKQIFKL